MEKLDKLSDYEDYGFWRFENYLAELVIGTLLAASVTCIGSTLILLMVDASTISIIVTAIIGLLTFTPIAYRLHRCHLKKKKYNVLRAEYNKIDDQISMLMRCFSGWGMSPNTYSRLYNHLNSCNYDRYMNGKIEKCYYIDELFFGKLKAYIALTKSIENVTLDEESNQQLMQIKQILDKSAEDYYNKMINYQNSQAKTSVKVTLDVFKEVG